MADGEGTQAPVSGGAVTTLRSAEDTLATVRTEMVRGGVYTQSQLASVWEKLLETTTLLVTLAEVLVERGVVSFEELDARKGATLEKLAPVFHEAGMGAKLAKSDGDKYACAAEIKVDCERRMPICHAACCRLHWALSRQDMAEGLVRWDLGDPFMNRREESDGYCHHLDRDTGFCSIRENRPLVCRTYTCETDSRIWKDFAAMELQPDLKI